MKATPEQMFSRGAQKFFVRDFRIVVRGEPVRGYREYVRGLKNTIEWYIKLLLRAVPFKLAS